MSGRLLHALRATCPELKGRASGYVNGVFVNVEIRSTGVWWFKQSKLAVETVTGTGDRKMTTFPLSQFGATEIEKIDHFRAAFEIRKYLDRLVA